MRKSKTHTKKNNISIKLRQNIINLQNVFFLEISCIQMMAHVLMKCIFHFYQQCQCFLKSFALFERFSITAHP